MGMRVLLLLLTAMVVANGAEIYVNLYEGSSCSSTSSSPQAVQLTLGTCTAVTVTLSSSTLNIYLSTTLSGSTYSTTIGTTSSCDTSSYVSPNPVAAATDICTDLTIVGTSASMTYSTAAASDAVTTSDCTTGTCTVNTATPTTAPTNVGDTTAPTTAPTTATAQQVSSPYQAHTVLALHRRLSL